jgi:DNA-binding PadR family transcriptional regulator
MRVTPKISLLGYALLGLIQQQPLSGYALRKVFTATPMGSFSDSPGAIYPALGRLEAEGLIQGTVEDGSGMRRRKVYRLKPAGAAALKRWYALPVTRDDVVRNMGELMLRFAFLGGSVDSSVPHRFLRSLREQLSIYLPQVEEYATIHEAEMPLSGRLALDHGIRGYRASLEWVEAALAAYALQEKGIKQ